MKTYSYHIFYFPFKWNIKDHSPMTLSESLDFKKVQLKQNSNWERVQKADDGEEELLYNEKNYYYKFVHRILYDTVDNDCNLIFHFERKECKDSRQIQYIIKKKGRDLPYVLDVDYINMNIYSTGVGFLSFYLANHDESQSDPDSVLSINQYGRRIMPPFYNDIRSRIEISEYIEIKGLDSSRRYVEDFYGYSVDDDWKQGAFISTLIDDLSDNISIEPIIDDRMFVASWYKNSQLAFQFKDNETLYNDVTKDFSSFWYKFLFIDSSSETCQNDEMKKELLEKHTYKRWQKYASLYGCSRYSMVFLAQSDEDGAPDFLFNNFNTIYARMIELVLVQRASTLRFSEEVTKLSNLSNQEVGYISCRISSLYKEYIRFVNQIYFRSVTAQEQGIELYTMLQNNINLPTYIKDLDEEIGELFNYIFLKEERDRNDKATFLNNIAILFLPATFITGFFGMNKWNSIFDGGLGIVYQVILILVGLICAFCIIYKRKKRL